MPRLTHAICFALCTTLALPAAAQSGKPQANSVQPAAPLDDPAVTCANLFNWGARNADALPEPRQNRFYELLSSIADPQVYATPSPTDCASVLQIMAQEGFDISDLGLHAVTGVAAQCDEVLPFIQQRYLALEPDDRSRIRNMMDFMNVPLYGRSDDLLACAILHGTLDRLNLFEVMQEI